MWTQIQTNHKSSNKPQKKKRKLPKRLIEVIEGNSNQQNNGKNVNTVLSKENVKCMIKEILNQEFTKQEEILQN